MENWTKGQQNDTVSTELTSFTTDQMLFNIEGKTKAGTNLGYELCFTDKEGKERLWQQEEITPKADGSFAVSFSFDPISLGIYQGAVSFTGKLKILSKEGEYCLSTFCFAPKEEEKQSPFKDSTPSYSTGNQQRKPGEKIPFRKVLLAGNSLLLGMCNLYGMCASSPKKDYAWYLEEALRKAVEKQSGKEEADKIEFRKIHGAPYEQAEDTAQADDWFYTMPNQYTGRPAKESFTEDLDLIVLQLSDNINSKARVENLKRTVDDFVTRIKEACPKAKLVWVFGWFNRDLTADCIMEACERHGLDWVDISDLHTTENEGFHGQSYELSDGTKEIAPDLWITHPGDRGMRQIADRILEALGIDND